VGSTAELELGAEPNAVPRARRFASSALVGETTATIEDAELLVTELVTNALLHGDAPVKLRLIQLADRMRIEVEDRGRGVPIQVRHSTEAMTGRGLSLVSAVASSWGVDPAPNGGKVVWAEIHEADAGAPRAAVPDLDVDELLAGWTDELDAEPRYTIHLGAVPTDLLLDAKSHIDNVVRELTLAKGNETSTGEGLPPAMTQLVESVTKDFAEARTEIKRQAIEAAGRGEALTTLSLTLTASAADAGERYLAALDEADRYARAARMLTMAPKRSHSTFRRWYVQSLVDQLRAASRGEPLPTPRQFSEYLAAEADRLASLEDTWNRLQLLQKVTGELTGARSVTDIATTVVDNAVEFLGAQSARVYLRTEYNTLRAVATHGGLDVRADEAYQEFSLDDELPGAQVVRTGQPLVLRTLNQLGQQFPALANYYPTERTLHVAPMTIGDHSLGVLSLTFAGNEVVDEETQAAFVRALADALAQAVERAQAIERAEEANERLAFLADASVALSTSLDFEATLAALTRLMVPRLADWCVVQMVDEDTLETVALLHSDPEKTAWGISMAGKFAMDMNAERGAAAVLRTGRSEVYHTFTDEALEQGAMNDEHLSVIRALGMSSGIVVPLQGRGGTFGILTLVHAESGRQYDATDLPFVEDVARRAALALETAKIFREQSGRLADVTQVAEAAQLAILAMPPSRLGPVSLSARYVSAAAEALIGGDLYEVVHLPTSVRMLIGDVRGKGLNAVRTATVVLGEFRAAAADVPDLGLAASQIDRRLRPYLADEDFVTALIAEINDDGQFQIVCCGHPPALLASKGSVTELPLDHDLPLGLGTKPTVYSSRLGAGDRLMLYTDGAIEARDAEGHFIDLMKIVAPIAAGPLDLVLDQVLAGLHEITGPALGDDLALLVAEYNPPVS